MTIIDYFDSLLQKGSQYIPPDQRYSKSGDLMALVQDCLSNEVADQADRRDESVSLRRQKKDRVIY